MLRFLLTLAMTAAIAGGIVILLRHASFTNAAQVNEMSAPIMFIIATIAIIIALVTLIIRRSQ